MKITKKRIKKKYVVLLIILLAAYLLFAFTRQSEYSTYVPFSGKVFNIKREDVDAVCIFNGNQVISVDLDDDQQIQQVVELLNGLRYQFWIPVPPIGSSGYSYLLWLEIDGERIAFKFNKNQILVKNVWYFCGDHCLSALTDMVSEPVQEHSQNP